MKQILGILIASALMQSCLLSKNQTNDSQEQYGTHTLSGKWTVVETQPISYWVEDEEIEGSFSFTTRDEHIGMLELFDDYTFNGEFWDWDLDPINPGQDTSLNHIRDYDDEFITTERISKWRIDGDTLALDLTAEFKKRLYAVEEYKPIEYKYIYQLKNDTLSLFIIGNQTKAKEESLIPERNYHYVRK